VREDFRGGQPILDVRGPRGELGDVAASQALARSNDGVGHRPVPMTPRIREICLLMFGMRLEVGLQRADAFAETDHRDATRQNHHFVTGLPVDQQSLDDLQGIADQIGVMGRNDRVVGDERQACEEIRERRDVRVFTVNEYEMRVDAG
jgi:hypothetical protein